MEHQDLAHWRERALEENRTTATIQVMLALVRVGGPELQGEVLERLNRLPFEQLDKEQILDAFRSDGLSFIRMGGKRQSASYHVWISCFLLSVNQSIGNFAGCWSIWKLLT